MFKKQQEGQGQRDQHQVIEHLGNGYEKLYQRGRLLGRGGFAQCYQFISEETGKRYAAKVINKETLAKGKAKEKLQSEILIHKSMKHQHIVKFQHFFEDHQNVYILLELCANNTLNQLLKRRKIITETETKFYMLQIIEAVKYIHNHKIIHRDLKLGNFFLSDGLEVKVGDFGLATALSYQGERRKTICGTPNYIAPEILEGKKGHSYEVDVWSLGVIAFALLFGKPPFETNDVKTTYEKIKICDFSFPKISVSISAKNFITKMLKVNPHQRASLDQLLNDDFLKLSEIPKTLPLSTLACPPSKAFLEQIKYDHRDSSEIKVSQNDELEGGMNSSRTQRLQSKGIAITERLDSFRNGKSRKSERSMGSITRTISSAAIFTRKKANSNIQEAKTNRPLVIHFEQHSRYGLFYLVSNGVIGMRFNDITCLTTNSSFKKFRYAALRNNIVQTEVETFEAGQQRQGLVKKMKIINHFYKEYKLKNEGKIIQKGKDSNQIVYVIAHFITSHYCLFWLSNNSFHAKFQDDTDIFVDPHSFIFVAADRKEAIYQADKISAANQDLRAKFNHISNLIKKVKRNRVQQPDDKKQIKQKTKQKEKEKQNQCLLQSCSSSKLLKKQKIATGNRQFSSTANLQLKKPLLDYASNK